MVFQPNRRSQIVSMSFPQLRLCNFCIKYVESFIYLGHIILCIRKDNDDIQREVRNLFMRTNICLFDVLLTVLDYFIQIVLCMFV